VKEGYDEVDGLDVNSLLGSKLGDNVGNNE
jgi:hypothetical protein